MLEKGISVPTMLYTYTPGGSVLNQSFLWRVPDNFSVQDSLSLNQRVVSKLNDDNYANLPYKSNETTICLPLRLFYARGKAL